MARREAKFQIVWNHWMSAYGHRLPPKTVFELKQTRTNALAFDAVVEHQIDWLLAANSYQGVHYKIPDDSRGIKPFDGFYIREAFSIVVIKYPGQFSIIDIHTFLSEKKKSARKSLTKERAEEIAWSTVKLPT